MNKIGRVPGSEIFSLVYNAEMKQTIIGGELRMRKMEVKRNYREAIICRLSQSVNKVPFTEKSPTWCLVSPIIGQQENSVMRRRTHKRNDFIDLGKSWEMQKFHSYSTRRYFSPYLLDKYVFCFKKKKTCKRTSHTPRMIYTSLLHLLNWCSISSLDIIP